MDRLGRSDTGSRKGFVWDEDCQRYTPSTIRYGSLQRKGGETERFKMGRKVRTEFRVQGAREEMDTGFYSLPFDCKRTRGQTQDEYETKSLEGDLNNKWVKIL